MKLVIFKSFEEMEAHQMRTAAEIDPVQGLKQTLELILRVYGLTREKLKERKRDNKIIITRRE